MRGPTSIPTLTVLSCLLVLGPLACTPEEDYDDTMPMSRADSAAGMNSRSMNGPSGDMPEGPRITEAMVGLNPTEGGDVRGTLRFTPVAGGGVRVAGTLQGLPPGSVHAAHVHVNGDCSAPNAESAGSHFNFENPGKPTPDATRIVGNLGEFTSDADGTSSESWSVSGAALNGPSSIVGRAVVIHESGNEPGPPSGSQSGARVACGVVGITGSAAMNADQAGEADNE